MNFHLNFIVISTLIFVNFLTTGVNSLRNMKLGVPEAVRLGDTITLTCDYDLESQALYSVKWYRNDEEFYRFIPKESPPSRVFAMDYINVDISRSNSRKVTLRNVEKETSGNFQCEVSSDAPSFHTDMRQAKLIIAEVPNEEPVLRTDIHHKITPGAKLNANCTTPGSYPSMNVTWYINNEKVTNRPDVQSQNSIVYYDALPGLETVRSSISVDTSSSLLFKNGKINLKCVATLFDLYNETKEIEILEDTPQIAPIREHHTENGFSMSQGYSNRLENSSLKAALLLFSCYFINYLRFSRK